MSRPQPQPPPQAGFSQRTRGFLGEASGGIHATTEVVRDGFFCLASKPSASDNAVVAIDPATNAQEAAAGSSDPQELRLIWHENSLLMITEAFYEGSLEDRDATLVHR